MSKLRFDLRTLLLWMSLLAIASAVARFSILIGAALAVMLTLALVRTMYLLRLNDQHEQYQPSSVIVANVALLFLTLVLSLPTGVIVGGFTLLTTNFFIPGISSGFLDRDEVYVAIALGLSAIVAMYATWLIWRDMSRKTTLWACYLANQPPDDATARDKDGVATSSLPHRR